MRNISLGYTPAEASRSAERADALVAWLRAYCGRRVNFRLADERRCLPPHLVMDGAAQGLFGLLIDERHGGLALRPADVARVQAQASAIDLGFGTFLNVSWFPGTRPLQAFLGEPLRAQLLPRLARGEILGAYAQTEAGAGSHFQALETVIRPAEGGGWELSGDKMWIGNGSWAGLYTVLGYCADELSAYLVMAGDRGVNMGPEQLTMGMRGMVQNLIAFRRVPVDESRLLGGAGAGLQVALDSMSWTRFGLTASALGAMQRCVQLMGRFVARRRFAGGTLASEVPAIQAVVGETIARAQATEALVARLAVGLSEGLPVEIFALAKYLSSELLWSSADALVQLLGGRGYDEANPAPRLLRDARVYRIFEGASEPLVEFVGQRALAGLFGPRSFEPRGLRDPQLEGRVKEALALLGEGEPRRGHPSPAVAAGEIVSWAVLLACVEGAAGPGATPAVGRWVAAKLEELLERARRTSPAEAVRFPRAELLERAAAVSRSIGDVDALLPGEQQEVDPLLAATPLPG